MMTEAPPVEIPLLSGKAREEENDVIAYLFRELALRRWIEDIVGEDLEEKAGGPGEGGLAKALKDGVRLCKVMLFLVPKSIPKIFENDSEFNVKKNIDFFIQALEELENFPSHLIFTVGDLYDQDNFLKVMYVLDYSSLLGFADFVLIVLDRECLEALGRKADEEWNPDISFKTKELLLRTLRKEIKFTPAQEERTKKMLEKCLPKKRSTSRGTTPTTTPRTRLKEEETPLKDSKKPSGANTKIRKKKKKDGEGKDATSPGTAQLLLACCRKGGGRGKTNNL